jgi:tRNA(fMet)-specific endonuclease VapC
LAVVIDSSVIIGWERRDIDPVDVVRFVPNEPTFIASVTVSELLVGVYRANSEARRVRRAFFVESVIAVFTVAEFALDAARVYARLSVDMMSSGRQINSHDVMIAATALSRNCDVLTDNIRHFHQIPGLIVRRPNW